MDLAALFSTVAPIAFKFGPAIIAFIQTEGPVIAKVLQDGQALFTQLQAAGHSTDSAATKAGALTVASVAAGLGGVTLPNMQTLLANLPVPIVLPTGTFKS
jgi:hypothetical protein